MSSFEHLDETRLQQPAEAEAQLVRTGPHCLFYSTPTARNSPGLLSQGYRKRASSKC